MTDQGSAGKSAEPGPVRGAAVAAVCVVVAGALATASGTWFSPQWKAGWLITGLGLVAVAVAWPRRIREVPADEVKRRATAVLAFVSVLVLCVAAVAFALTVSVWFHGRDLDDTATLRVQALTVECEDSGEHGQKCHYSYVVNGREYLGDGNFGGSLPVTLRVDPAHPGDLGRADQDYRLLWVGIVLSALTAAGAAWGLVDGERDLARLGRDGYAPEPELDTPEARSVAEAEGFGSFVARKKMPGSAVFVGGCMGAVLLIVFGVALVAATGFGSAPSLVGVVLLVAAVAVVVLTVRRDRRDTARAPIVYGYESGMVIASERGCEPHSWQDVVPFEFMQALRSSSGQGSSSRTSYHRCLELRSPAGTKLLGFLGQREVDRFAELLAAYEVPRAQERLERGESVTYGQFTLSAAALTVDGTAHPWRDIHHVTTADHEVGVVLRTGETLSALPGETPHLRALRRLMAHRIRNGGSLTAEAEGEPGGGAHS
ncbi:hypothetical protein ACFYS8_06365 [Kitasatospora sp. NPDC004615]|uniref:hypothetical protein n=1 Tax=Kitasatospora sp. NPDC004615 TaxID=3364017 RepID=UPI0036882BEB